MLKSILENRLNQAIKFFAPLSGGDINQVYLIHTSREKLVVKTNKTNDFPEMLLKEKKGLETLQKYGVSVPGIQDCFVSNNYQFLILSFVQEESVTKAFWQNLATDLVKIHQSKSTQFGLTYDNYIGSLPQQNRRSEKWIPFFIHQRLEPLVKMAYDNKLLKSKEKQQFENLYARLSELLPEEPPTLLHGDLWRGNVMCGREQTPVFIDPAIYYGHREMDIAMTQLFGGFDVEYLFTYNQIFPLEKGWQQRQNIFNLYPNLVHLNLFGVSYLKQIQEVLIKFS